MATCAAEGCKKRANPTIGRNTWCTGHGLDHLVSRDPIGQAHGAEQAEASAAELAALRGHDEGGGYYAHPELMESAEAHAEVLGKRRKAFYDGRHDG